MSKARETACGSGSSAPSKVIEQHGQRIDLGGPQPRSLLAMLLIASGRIVPVDTIIGQLWDGEPPVSAGGTLQSSRSSWNTLRSAARA